MTDNAGSEQSHMTTRERFLFAPFLFATLRCVTKRTSCGVIDSRAALALISVATVIC